MTVKAVLFDLDGVLFDSDELHFNALNMALVAHELPTISAEVHNKELKALPTSKKLEILVSSCRFPEQLAHSVAATKQIFTSQLIRTLKPIDQHKVSMLKNLRSRGIRIAICSNSLKKTIDNLLDANGIHDYVDLIVSQEDVLKPKPAPDVYLRAMSIFSLNPKECLVVEDSDVGYQSAIAAGVHVMRVLNSEQVHAVSIMREITRINEIQVLIPAAGRGQRFASKGYDLPKPLIDVLGRPMIEWVLENINNVGRPILLFQDQDISEYRINDRIEKLNSDALVFPVDGITEGALCTALKARSVIDNDNELLIINSDQYLEFDLKLFIDHMRKLDVDGGILCFPANDPKWSYAAINEDGQVIEVAEKRVISNLATVGVYYFKKGSDFVESSDQLIAKNIRVNGEFYICPVFNELISNRKKIAYYEIPADLMHGLGTPEDLEKFLEYRQCQDERRGRVRESEYTMPINSPSAI